MTGLKYHRLLQTRLIDDLTALTGVDRNTIAQSEDQIIPDEPCGTYMRLASALGITVDELITNRGDEFDEVPYTNDGPPETVSLWEASFGLQMGTLCRVYLAKINGLHPKFHFDREFQQMHIVFRKDAVFCSADRLEEGVYEVCARWFKYGSSIVVDRSIHWFAFYDGIICTLDKDDVLAIVSAPNEAHSTDAA